MSRVRAPPKLQEPKVPERPPARNHRKNSAVPGVVAPLLKTINRDSKVSTPPTVPVKKPRKLANSPPDQPLETPAWTQPETQTQPPVLKSVSPVKKRRWFEWGTKSKERSRPLKLLVPQSQHRVVIVPQPHQDQQYVEPFRKVALGKTPKLPGGALQRQKGQSSQPKLKRHDQGSSSLAIRADEHLSRQFQLYSQQDMYCHTLNPIFEGDKDNSSCPQPMSFRRDFYISTWAHPPVRGNSAPPAKNYYPASSIAPVWKICPQGRIGAGPEITSRNEPRQPPFCRDSPVPAFHQSQAQKFRRHQKEGNVCSKAAASQHRPQNHSKSSCACRTAQDEEYHGSIRKGIPSIPKAAHMSRKGQAKSVSKLYEVAESSIPEMQEKRQGSQAKTRSQTNHGHANSTV